MSIDLKSVLHFSRSKGRGNGNGRLPSLLDHELFERALIKERSRANRRSSSFALLIMDISIGKNEKQYLDAVHILTDVLNERTRIEDSKGVSGEHIGLILTEMVATATIDVSARIQAEFDRRVCDTYSDGSEVPKLSLHVYGYPGDEEAQRTVAGDEIPSNGKTSLVDQSGRGIE